MRAAVYDGNSISLDARRADPAPAPGEALVRPTRIGIAAADLALVAGRGAFRGVVGHECCGVVEDVNGPAEVKAKLKGRRVVVGPVVVCGKCDMCRAGLGPHCRQRAVIGLLGRDGAMADRLAAPVHNLTVIPDGVDDDRAVFASPLASALHTRQVFRAEGKPYITVLGDGRLGLLVVQVMARLNAKVRLLGRNPARLALCDKWQIKHRPVDEAGRRADQDVVVDCTGKPEGLAIAMAMVRPRGRIVQMSAPGMPGPAVGPAGTGVDLSPIIGGEIELVGSRCGTISEALESLRNNEVDVVSLVTRRGKLADAPGLFQAAASREQIKVLVEGA